MDSSPSCISKGIILIVDDTPDNLRLLSSMLKEQGYEVRKALSGKAALLALQTLVPDLILLDIKMPDIDGYEICRQLKAVEKTAQIPIIFLSALDDVNDKVKAFAVGGIDYITKPFQTQEVLVRVENHLMTRRLQQKITEQNLKLAQQNGQLMQEIQIRKQVQQELQQLNEELTRANIELEQFAYTASHDLSSPLQIIICYAEIIRRQYRSVLDEEADSYISQISEAGARMKQLIDDLLNYSRTGAQMVSFQVTDCNAVVEQAIANLYSDIVANTAAITYGKLPLLPANSTQLVQLFQNLLSNAIKFRRPDATPQVKIAAVLKDERWLFSIADNGIGIEAQNFERIFNVFERLNASQEYPGTGIGAAICKKIVEIHGGQIWVDSQIGIGTTFYFTLPAKWQAKGE